ncbi:lycopene cyclase domain-containing protein [Cellulomonas oligotrophica]|uniref:Lycopene cyclase domain-containing protein n=1 Tax=Cellulomonas oligotrophica TaxID=931536 RepID=A0A7Y9JXJ8_9CELL|nr:lycopene cyclase domain-containing protein [Cellulomonas oligotrophica]NYD85727.1 lycopene cyclase domain-containing protein [Cellulomonas oligotrophica]GIG31266.1 hypothetical protein Col01nite_04250 [Cellulomonas oligotrophica]
MTYALVNTVFFVPVVLVAAAAVHRARRRGARPHVPVLLAAGAVMMLLTAVFDNVLVGAGLVGYDPARILGWRIGVAPVEDFAYTVAALVLLPSVWELLRREPPPG